MNHSSFVREVTEFEMARVGTSDNLTIRTRNGTLNLFFMEAGDIDKLTDALTAYRDAKAPNEAPAEAEAR